MTNVINTGRRLNTPKVRVMLGGNMSTSSVTSPKPEKNNTNIITNSLDFFKGAVENDVLDLLADSNEDALRFTAKISSEVGNGVIRWIAPESGRIELVGPNKRVLIGRAIHDRNAGKGIILISPNDARTLGVTEKSTTVIVRKVQMPVTAPQTPPNRPQETKAEPKQADAADVDTYETGDNILSSVEITLAESYRSSSCSVTLVDPHGKIANKYITASYAIGGIELHEALFDQGNSGGDTLAASNDANIIEGGCGLPSLPSQYAVLSTLAKHLSTNSHFNTATAQGRAALVIALAIGGTETFGVLNDNNLFTVLGGTGNRMKGFAQYNLAYHDKKIDTPDKYMTFLGQHINGLAPLPNGRKARNFASDLASKVGNIADGTTLISFLKSGGSNGLGGSNWQGIDDGWRRVPGLADALISYLRNPPNDCSKPTASGIIAKKGEGEGYRIAFRDKPSGDTYEVTAGSRTAVVTSTTAKLLRDITAIDNSVVLTPDAFEAIRPLNHTGNELEVTINKQAKGATPTSDQSTDVDTEVNSDPTAQTVSGGRQEPGIIELSERGTLITIEVTIDPGVQAVFAFIHNATKHSFSNGVGMTTLTGTTVKWNLSQIERNTKYKEITVKGLASAIAKSYGIELVMDFEGPTIEIIDQRGETDYRLLRRICDTLGYKMYELGSKLVIDQYNAKSRPGFFVAKNDTLIDLTLNDVAQSGKLKNEINPDYVAGETKVVTDSNQGIFRFINPESSATKNNTAPGATGSNIPPLQSDIELRKAAEQAPQETKSKSKTKSETSEVQSLLGIVGTAQRTAEKPAKEYSGELTCSTTTAALLTATPDTPFNIMGYMDFLESDGRSFLIESVTHTINDSGALTRISFYLPTAAKRVDEGGSISPTDAASPTERSTTVTSSGISSGKWTVISLSGNFRGRSNDVVQSIFQCNEHWLGTGAYTAYVQDSRYKFGRYSYDKTKWSGNRVYDLQLRDSQGRINGIDYPAAVSGKIKALIGSGRNRGILFEDGTYMVHINPLSKWKAGMNVKRGEIIGKECFGSGAPHLHIVATESVIDNYIKSATSGSW